MLSGVNSGLYTIKPMLAYMPSDDLPGDRLKVLRESLGLSRRAAAKRSEGGVTHAHIGNLENDPAAWSKASQLVLRGLARAYNMPLEKLLSVVNGKAEDEFTQTPKNKVPVKNPTFGSEGLSDVFNYTSIKGLGADGDLSEVQMSVAFLQGRNPEDVIQVKPAGAVLACEEAKAEVAASRIYLFDKNLRPRSGDLVLYKLKGHELYVLRLWRDNFEQEVWVTSFDRKTAHHLMPDDPPLEFKGSHFFDYSGQRFSERDD